MARHSLSLLASIAVLFGAVTASAQSLTPESRPERPYRGVYASGTDEATQVLTVSGSAAGGDDTSAPTAATEAGVIGATNPASPKGSVYSQYSGSLSYSAHLNRLSAGASLSA